MARNLQQPILVMIQGEMPGERWKIDPTRVTSIGRSVRNKVQLLSPSVSRFHCEIAFSNGLWYISDLNSRKGTLLNGRDVENREVMKPGDVIRISGNLLRFTDEKELEDIVAGVDDWEESGIDLLQERSVREALEKEAGDAVGKKLRALTEWGKRMAKSTAIPLLAVTLSFGLSAAILAIAHSRAEERKERIERARSEFDAVMQRIEKREEEEVEHRELLHKLEDIARQHAPYPQARKAAEQYRAIEAEYFQQGMETAYDHIIREDYEAALNELIVMDGLVRTPELRDAIRKEIRNVSRMESIPVL